MATIGEMLPGLKRMADELGDGPPPIVFAPPTGDWGGPMDLAAIGDSVALAGRATRVNRAERMERFYEAFEDYCDEDDDATWDRVLDAFDAVDGTVTR